MRRTLLRLLLVFDAAALLLLGAAFILAPSRVLLLFAFENAPRGMIFMMGIFGAVYATMGIGTILAAQSPMRNVAWIQVTIARGIAESLFSLFGVATGMVAFRQGGFSIILPALVAAGCLALYPRPEPPPSDTPQDQGDPK